MNPYFMTEEQRRMQEMMAAAQRQSSPAAGMTNPYQPIDRSAARAAQAQDFTGQENQIERQRAVADSLRGTPVAKGKTVGPSNIYVAPNWAENLRTFGSKLAGGYVDKKANEADLALQPQRLSKAAAAGDLAEDEYQQRLSQQAKDEQLEAQLRDQQRADKLEAERVRVKELQDSIKREEAKGDLTQKRQIELEELKARLKREELELKSQLEDVGFVGTGLLPEQQKAIKGLSSGTERAAARMLINTSNDLRDLSAQAQAALEENPDLNWSSKKVDVLSDVATDFPIVGGDALRNVVKSAGYNEAEQKIRGVAANAVEGFRRARTGANLTGVEIKVGEDWDPTAPGIGPQESLRRTIALNKTVDDYLSTMGVPITASGDKREQEDASDIPDNLPDDVKAVWDVMTEDERALFR